MKNTAFSLLAVVFALLLTSSLFAADDYVPPRLIRVYYEDKAQIKALAEAGAVIHGPTDKYVDVIVEAGPGRAGDPVNKLLSTFSRVEVLQENLDKTLDRFRDKPDLGRYHTYDEALAEFRGWVERYPDLAKLYVLGQTCEGRDVFALKISDNVSLDEGEPGFLIVGTHHSREWIATEVPLAFAEKLLTGYNSDPKIKRLVDEREIWVLPIQNPDGFIYSYTQYRMWRKNRRDNGNNTFGVDPNRNYMFHWGEGGSSTWPSSDTYRGPSAASEPITRIVQDFAASRPNLKGSISYHSYGQLVLWPWSYTTKPAPDDAILGKIARKFATFNGYSPKQSSGLYPSSGDFDDYMYGVCGLTSFTVELGTQFIPDESKVDAICKKNVDALLWFVDAAADPYPVLTHEELGATTDQEGPYRLDVLFDGEHHADFDLVSVRVHWRKGDAGQYHTSELASAGNGLYRYNLPSQGQGTYHYYFEAVGRDGKSVRCPASGEFSFKVVESLYLLVDDDAGRNYENSYMAAFRALDLPVTVIDRSTAAPTAAQLAGASAVVWFCGDSSSNTLDKKDQEVLGAYLKAGGKFLLFGQDIGYELKNTSFYRDVLCARFVDDSSGIKSLEGAQASFLAGRSFSISGSDSVQQSYPEVISPINGARALALYAGGTKVGALAVDKPGYRLAYFGFGLEGIDGAEQRKAILASALDWVQAAPRLELIKAVRNTYSGLSTATRRRLALRGARDVEDNARLLVSLVEQGRFDRVRRILGPVIEQARKAGGMDRLRPVLRQIRRKLVLDKRGEARKLLEMLP